MMKLLYAEQEARSCYNVRLHHVRTTAFYAFLQRHSILRKTIISSHVSFALTDRVRWDVPTGRTGKHFAKKFKLHTT